MPPYNASLYTPSYTPTRSIRTTDYYSTSSNYLYKPPAYSSTKYCSTSRYSLNIPSSNLSSYSSSLQDKTWRSTTTDRRPSFSRNSSANSRYSLPIISPITQNTCNIKGSFGDADLKPGDRVGLNNLGNTCFMNAVLQCLCHTQPLVDYCIKGSYLRDINHRSPTRGELIKVFAEFVQKMVDSKATTPISPYQLRTEIQRCAPRFSGDNQQDAQEFLRYLLQGLHDDTNRVQFKTSSRYLNDCGRDAIKAWDCYTETDDSKIVDLFAGQLKSTLTCTDCNKKSITHDPFWDLSLPIPEGYRNHSLRQCLALFSSPEILDGSNKPICEACNKKTISRKEIKINRFPKVLVMHLKRFSASSFGQKLKQMIESPLILGNLSEFASSSCIRSYTLYGVVDHDGSNNSGHYTAKCFNPNTKEWREFNDSRVLKATNIVTSKMYILFYIQN